MIAERRYPIGIQTFPEIVRGGYVYIDKTESIWELARYAKYIFLSRPRRFGKSLLTSTLESYFQGEKDLFKGLKIMELEKEWEKYPVLRLDVSTSKGQPTAEALRARLMLMMKDYTELYGKDSDEVTPGGLESRDVKAGFALKFWRALKQCNVHMAMQELQAYMANIPYVEGFKKKLEDVATAEGSMNIRCI